MTTDSDWGVFLGPTFHPAPLYPTRMIGQDSEADLERRRKAVARSIPGPDEYLGFPDERPAPRRKLTLDEIPEAL